MDTKIFQNCPFPWGIWAPSRLIHRSLYKGRSHYARARRSAHSKALLSMGSVTRARMCVTARGVNGRLVFPRQITVSSSLCRAFRDISSEMRFSSAEMKLLGPFYGAIAVPSVTRCRCCCRCGHRFYIAIHQVSLLLHAACAIAIADFGSSW